MTDVLRRYQDTDNNTEDHVKTEEDIHLQRQRPPVETNPANTLILDFWPPERRENRYLLCNPPSLWHTVMVALGNYYKNKFEKVKIKVQFRTQTHQNGSQNALM